jgi:hypothetical protein
MYSIDYLKGKKGGTGSKSTHGVTFAQTKGKIGMQLEAYLSSF